VVRFRRVSGHRKDFASLVPVTGKHAEKARWREQIPHPLRGIRDDSRRIVNGKLDRP
jgi:hypothetical protein